MEGGLFTHQRVVFPGPDGRNVICYSWLDSSFIAFSVDLHELAEQKTGIARVPLILEEAVEASDLPVSA